MVTSVTATSANDSRSSNVSVPGPATSVRNTAALVSTMSSNSPGTPAPKITVSSSSFEALSSPVAGPTMAQPTTSLLSTSTQTGVSASGVGSAFEVGTPQVVPSTSPNQVKATKSRHSTSVQQSSSSVSAPTPTPQQNGQSSDQPSISTIQSTTVVTEAATPTATSTSTLFPVSTLSKPVVVTQVTQNGSTSVFTPSFVTVLTTSTNSDGSAVTWTGVYANPSGDPSSQHQTFFQNTGAVAGVFTVLGIVVAFIILCAVYFIRRSRRKRRQSGWQSPAASFDRFNSPTMRSVSSEIPSEVSRSRMPLPTQDYSRGYLPVHVDVVQETERYPPEQGPSLEPTQRPRMVSLTHNRLSSYSPSVPIPSEPVQDPRQWPSVGPFTDASVLNSKRLSLMRDNRPNYLPKIPIAPEAGPVSRRLSTIERPGEVSVGPTKMVFPIRDNVASKRPSILVSAEPVRGSQQSSTEIRNIDPSKKWKVRLPASLPPTYGNDKAIEETSSSSQSTPSIYPSSLPPIESEDESTTVGGRPGGPTVKVEKQAAIMMRPHSAGAPPRPPRSVLRSLSFRDPQSYYTLDSLTPSPISSTTADSPQAIFPRRTLLDVRPRSAPQGTPRAQSMYQ